MKKKQIKIIMTNEDKTNNQIVVYQVSTKELVLFSSLMTCPNLGYFQYLNNNYFWYYINDIEFYKIQVI